MRITIGWLILCGGIVGIAGPAIAAEDVVTLSLRDGSRLVGRVVAEDESSVRVVTSGGLEVTVPRASIVPPAAAREVAGDSARLDPNYSRLMFAPTARPLKRGEGYFSDYELLFPGVAYGVTDNVTLAGGFSVIPGLGLREQLFYISPKIGFDLGERASVAVGGLIAGLGAEDTESVGVGFAVGTFGSPKHSVTMGVGIGSTSSAFSDAVPILMAGGTTTVSRHVALVGETWIALDDDFRLSEQPFGVGVRLFSDRMSADVGLILIGELLDEGFPIPWLSVTYHFGKRRDVLRTSGARTPPAFRGRALP